MVAAHAEGSHDDCARESEEARRSTCPSEDRDVIASTRPCIMMRIAPRAATIVTRSMTFDHRWLMVAIKRVASIVPSEAGMRK